MPHALFLIFTIFCIIIGYGLATNHVNIWGVFGLIIIGVTALEAAYILTAMVEAHFYG